LGVASAWNTCDFPKVDWFALDEGVGISYAYAVAAMNGNMYSGGYTKGNFAFVGIPGSDSSADVNPVPSATLWGDTTSNVQNLYIAEVSSTGSMTRAWMLKGSAIQVGQIGHGAQTNSIDSHSGMHAMLDKAHIAVKGGFRQLLTLPDGTVLSSATAANTKDQVPFVMSLDVSSTNGIGAGTTGWYKRMDDGHAGGASVHSVDGDANGNMIVSYKGCTAFDADATSTDAYGREVKGAMTGCKEYVMKLAAADGSQVWRHEVPHSLSSCRTITDGSFFCGWSMSASDNTLDFLNGITVVSEDNKVGIIKYNTAGVAQWAKATASTSFYDLAVSKGGALLAVTGTGTDSGGNRLGVVSRISTVSGSEGNVLWSDAGGVGTHGFRGVEVTDDDQEVFAFGQLTSTETLTDTTGKTITLRSRGSYEVFAVAYDASDGKGKWAMDGGGTGMEYFFAMANDPDTHAVYIGGTSRSEIIRWGDIKRENVMYNGQPGENNPDTSSAVGSSKAIVVKLKTETTAPSCLNTCNSAFPLQASDVKSGFCYIDRHCYADGDPAPYSGSECRKCVSASSGGDPLTWGAPDTSAACFISGSCVASGAHAQVRSGYSYVDDPCKKCDPSVSTSAYSDVAGCNLPSTFAAGCYELNGNMAMTADNQPMTLAKTQTMQSTITSMQASKTTLEAEVDTLKTDKTVMQTKLDNVQCEPCGNIGDELAIALIVVAGVMLLITSLTLCTLIYKEKKGRAVFVPAVGPQMVVGSPVGSAGEDGKA
jgi:hypothetical protein